LEYFEVADIVDEIIDTLRPDNVQSTYVAHLSNITPAPPNFELLRPLFFGRESLVADVYGLKTNQSSSEYTGR
jgi:uncharacterized protein related to proFAR isomerase